jgi:uncharacterized repeat protein (TIGR03833 family)
MNGTGEISPSFFLHLAYNRRGKFGGVAMDGKKRSDVKPGLEVNVILKQDQRSGKKTRGIVKDLLTNSPTHPHGIKVRLQDGQVGRVCEILSEK